MDEVQLPQGYSHFEEAVEYPHAPLNYSFLHPV